MTSLKEFTGSCVEDRSGEGVMSLTIMAAPSEFDTIITWLTDNGVRLSTMNATNANCIVTPTYSWDRYTFTEITPAAVGFRLLTETLDHSWPDLYYAYCEYLTTVCSFQPVPRRGRRGKIDTETAFVKELANWADHSGIALYNLKKFDQLNTLPMSGRVMFMLWREADGKQRRELMPILMFFDKDDAMLYKLAF